jgi:hypothetical protein
MKSDKSLRQHVLDLLEGGHAHPDFSAAVKNLPDDLRGKRPDGFPHSVWELVEHMRVAQWDIIEYVLNPDHVSPDFPSGYWPRTAAPRDERAWDKCVSSFRADLKRLADLLRDESTDILAPVSFANGATILRQALLAADHNAYHIGQVVTVRRLLGAWES